jgi:colanic acid/amylovoran biosynthesis protein
MTDAPPRQVEAVLAPLRGTVDEVVLALDAASVPPAEAGAYEPLADVLVSAPFAPPLERSLAWLHSQCSAEWVFRLDSDEIPSTGLGEALLEVASDRTRTHAWVPRRWLFPDAEHILDQRPWWPDYQLRFVRNDPPLLSVPGLEHTSARMPGPARFLLEPIYHADCLLANFARRDAKAREYERRRPGARVAGQPMNKAYYLPERRPDHLLRPVPPQDHAAILRLLEGARAPHVAVHATRTREVTQQEIDDHWVRRPMDAARVDGLVEPRFHDRELVAGETTTFMVKVHNVGTERWGSDPDLPTPTMVAYQWLDAQNRVLADGPRTPLPAEMRPGTAEMLPLHVIAPRVAGTYQLRVGIVQEHVRWFGQSDPVPLTVSPCRRIAVIAGYSPYRHVGDDAIVQAHLAELADRLPDVEPVLLGEDPAALAARFGTAAAPSIHTALYANAGPGAGRMARLATLARGIQLVRRARTPGGWGTLPPAAQAFLEEVAACDALLAASAGGLTGRYWREVLWPHAFTILAARAVGVPSIVSGVTIGPLEKRLDALVAAAALRAASRVVTRDRSASPRALRALGVRRRRVLVAPDPAVALATPPAEDVDAALLHAGIVPDEPFVAVSIHRVPWAGHAADAVAAALRSELASDLAVLFVPMVEGAGEADDRGLAGALTERVRHASVHVLVPLPRDDILAALVRRARLAIGTRYHLAVFASAGGVPAIGLHGDGYAARKFEGLRSFAGERFRAVALPADDGEMSRLIETCFAALSGTRNLGASFLG